jgi:uncharacterized protein YqeY
MSLEQKILADLKTALKQRNSERMAALRLLVADFHNAQIEKNQKLSEADEVQVLQKAAKQREESIEAYKKGKREDLVKKEEAELQIIKEYLPQQLNEEQIRQVISNLPGWEEAKTDFGQAMHLAMEKLKGQAEGSLVAKVVREML